MEIDIFNTPRDMHRAFTERLKKMLSEKERIAMALSGGSTPKSLFDYWAQLPKGEIDWNTICFFWGDERCVPPTDDESNYKMARERLFDFVPVLAGNIFRIHGETVPEMEAERYGDLIGRELETVDGIPSFDIIMLGMGDDGHTASIFPHEIRLWESPLNCVAATHPVTKQRRISLSGRVINAAKQVCFLVTGENKAAKVKEITAQPAESAKKYPAALVRPVSGNLCWFLDKAAGKLLVQ